MTGPLSGGDARTQLAEGAEVAAAWLFDFTMRRTNVAARWSDAEIGAGAISDGALRRAWHYEAERLLDALLPVVERIADERAAEVDAWLRELHQSDNAETPFCVECGHTFPCLTIREWDRRAASLRAASRGGAGL